MRIHAFADEASSNIDDQIGALQRNGLQGLEIRNVDGTSVSFITVKKAREVRKKLLDAGLLIWSVGSPIGKIDISNGDWEEHKERFKHTMEIAAELNAENIRLFSFYIPASADPDVYFDQVIQRLSWMAGIAEGSGITLCHENEKEIYGDIASRCLKIHQALPSFRGVFDPANFIQCGQDAAEAWTMLKGYVKYLHIKDALWDGTVVPAGEGEGQLHRIVADFIRMGGSDMTIEPHLVSFEGLSDLQRDQHKRRTDVHIYQDNNQAFDAACNALRNLLC